MKEELKHLIPKVRQGMRRQPLAAGTDSHLPLSVCPCGSCNDLATFEPRAPLQSCWV